ncbi:MAG: B12-binding domain-containing radical SAM protein [Treponema sp.]|nr:B12-binding domain-containing radical SAM protein [Treponema sp.]
MKRGSILLATINAKWIHPSLALRLLKANLGPLENSCDIIEFALRQPMQEKTGPILAARPQILGLSVSIWNHTATLELLGELRKEWGTHTQRPIIVLGGPEVSYLPPDAEIFRYADYCVCGEGEIAFRGLCEEILHEENTGYPAQPNKPIVFLNREFIPVNPAHIQSGYGLYTDEDLHKKLIYAEASRGCPYACAFCLSAHSGKIREFPLEPFFAEMDELIQRGARTIKFLDRTFNFDIGRAQKIMDYFLKKITGQNRPLTIHFEMVPSRFPAELTETITRFPPGTLRLEIGIQTLNPDVSARIGRPSDPERELAAIRLLREKTNAIIHADLIAGLPGEDMISFGKGFDSLVDALNTASARKDNEIQLGILKLLPGAPIARLSDAFGMCYSSAPPYEVLATSAISAPDMNRLKNFARFWELIVNRRLADMCQQPAFDRFLALSDYLFLRFDRNWGIPKDDLLEAIRTWG